MAVMQSQEQQVKRLSSSGNDTSLQSASSSDPSHVRSRANATSYLPNFLWYLPNAGDTSRANAIGPTSLCSGTGITGNRQYLQPDMLHMFGMFGSYFLGAGHLVQDNDDASGDDRGHGKVRTRRHAFWVETIEEDDLEDESESSSSTNSGSYDDDDESTELLDGSDSGHEQKSYMEKLVQDLNCNHVQLGDLRILPSYEIKDT